MKKFGMNQLEDISKLVKFWKQTSMVASFQTTYEIKIVRIHLLKKE
jgi:hypothetical protein